jgi:hypothetical protein
MKLWNKIKEQAVKVKDNFWRWWKDQGALKEKGPVEQTIQAEQSAALMDWADDGGPLPRQHPDSKDKLK